MHFRHCPICSSDFKWIKILHSNFLENSNIKFLDISPYGFRGVAIRKHHISDLIIMENINSINRNHINTLIPKLVKLKSVTS